MNLSLVINLGVLWGSGASSDREGREVSAFVTLSERLSNPTFSERPIRCSSWLMEDEWPGEYTPISRAGRRSSFGDTVEVLHTDYLEIGGDPIRHPIRPTILSGLNLKITPTVST